MNNEASADISVRPAKAEDFDQILQIKIDAHRTVNAPAYNAEQIEVMTEDIKYRHQLEKKQRETVFVAEMEGKIIGVSSLSERGVISALHIIHHCKHQEVGMQLLSAVENEARNRNQKLISLRTYLTGRPFYESCGYHLVGGRSSSYSKGVNIPYFYMEKWIISPTEWEKFLWDCYIKINSIGGWLPFS